MIPACIHFTHGFESTGTRATGVALHTDAVVQRPSLIVSCFFASFPLAAPTACGSFQAETESEPQLWPTPQLQQPQILNPLRHSWNPMVVSFLLEQLPKMCLFQKPLNHRSPLMSMCSPSLLCVCSSLFTDTQIPKFYIACQFLIDAVIKISLYKLWICPLLLVLVTYFAFSIFFFFFCSFYSCTCSIQKCPGQGSNQSCSCWPTPQPQQRWTRAISAAYTAVCSNDRSLTH